MANLSNINNILRTGSLGVGINRDPLGAFEISSATKPGVKMFNTSTNGKTYEAYSDTNGNYIIYDQDADDNRFVINTSGNATFAGQVIASSSSSGDYVRMYGGSGTAQWDIYGNGENLRFSENSGGGGHVDIDTNLIVDGNVGIGTASPSSKLVVRTSTDHNLEVEETGGELRLSALNNARYANIGLQFAASEFNFLTGNVGIGTSSPSTRLDVRLSSTTGKVAEFHNSVGYGIGFTVESDGGVNTINSESNQALAFATNGASNEKMRIDSSGHILMGKTSGSYRLDMETVAGGNAFRTTRGTSSFRIFQANNGASYMGTENNADLNIQTNATNRVIVTSAGNVSIGTTTSDGKLTVDNASGNTITIRKGTGTPAIAFGGTNANEAVGLLEGIAGGGFRFYTGSGTLASPTWAQRFIIAGDGDVYNYQSVNKANTFYGAYAGDWNSNTSGNTFVGYNVGNNLTTGDNNTGMGRDVFIATLTGDANTAVGTGAGRLLGTGSRNSCFGDGAGDKLANASDNVTIGYEALFTNVGGGQNVAIGVNAARDFTGSRLVAIGTNASKQLTSDVDNVFIGQDCGHHRVSGIDNTFVGAYANYNGNSTGCCNTGFGKSAGYELTSGVQNTFVGRQAGYSVTTTNDNTMVGHNSGIFVTGSNNTYVGSYSGDASNHTGSYNTGIGRAGLSAVTSGTYHTALGYNAGDEITTGTNCTAIGHAAGSGSSPRHMTTNSNEIVIGNNSVTGAYIRVAWTTGSDKRDKINFDEVPYGLEFVNKLKPTSYNLRKEREKEEIIGNTKYGFIAQEILELEGDNPVIIDNSDENKLCYQESNLIPVLVKAIQELKADNDSLKARIETLENK